MINDINDDNNDLDDGSNYYHHVINPIKSYYTDKAFLRYNFFYDIYRSSFRCVYYSLMIVGIIIVLSPLYVFSLGQFGFENTIFLDHTMKAISIEMSQFSMLTVILPMLFDTILDLLDRTKTINFEIHERIMFIIITIIHAIINITYYGTLKGAIYYIFINQASVIVANCCIFSCFSKLERAKTKEKVPMVIGFVLVITGAILKMYGFVYMSLMTPGILISAIGNIIQIFNCVVWMLVILNITPCKQKWGTISKAPALTISKAPALTDAEETVLVYFFIFICWIIVVFISNQATNSISWKASTVSNILTFQICHICLVFVVIAVPMRLSKKRQTLAFESITKLSTQVESDHMLLTQVLPADVVQTIQQGIKVRPKNFQQCTIFFSDIEGFTSLSSSLDSQEVMYMLDELYSVMDYVTAMFKKKELLKVETIGDAYMLVSGVQDTSVDHVRIVTEYALTVRKVISLVLNPITQEPLRIRIGIHTGKVTAGIAGYLTPHWSLFGDTVNTAARMETNSLPGKIHVSESTANILLKHDIYDLTKRDKISVKGKGLMQTYWVNDYKDNNYIDSYKLDKLQEECKMLIQKCKANRLDLDSLSEVVVDE